MDKDYIFRKYVFRLTNAIFENYIYDRRRTRSFNQLRPKKKLSLRRLWMRTGSCSTYCREETTSFWRIRVSFNIRKADTALTNSALWILRAGGNERRLPAAARFFCLVSKLILSNKNVRTFTFYHNGYNRDESNQKERCLTWQM